MKHALLSIFICSLLFLGLGILQPAAAQTAYTTAGKQKRELRSSLKEAKRIETDYNESHLNVDAYNHKRGENGRKLKKSKKKDLMPIQEDGTAVMKPKLFSKKSAQAKARKK
jgi:lipopolysaccharide export LptBFGC system permease protein LptF